MEFKAVAEDAGRAVLAAVDKACVFILFLCAVTYRLITLSMSTFPRWRNLNHFNAIMHVDFSDGGKHEDIAKVQSFGAQIIFRP